MLKILPLFVVVVISRVEAYHEHDQRPIAATDDNIYSPRRASVHIREAQWRDAGYSVNISIGSPPQEVEVYLDISSPDSWVTPATLPTRYRVCRNASVFNTNASSSFFASDVPAQFSNGWLWGRGNISYDTIGYGGGGGGGGGGGVTAQHQAFAVPNYVSSDSYIFNPCPMAGVMGLAPFRSRIAADDFGKPSPFMTMVGQNALERNLFALRLAEPAELSFGWVNRALFQAPFLANVPLTRNLSGIWDGGWQTTASYLALDDWDANKSSHSDLGDVPATFITSSPAIHLPEPVYDRVLAAAGCARVNGPWLPPAADCSRRFMMPNVTFNFAGQNLTLTAFDYTIPWYLEPGNPDCTCMFTTSSGFEWSSEFVLGWAFMRKFYSVFDLDEGEIKFATLS